jgi:hypothetical protein
MKKTPDIRDRARAAGCYLNNVRNARTGEVPRDLEMAAFMSIFHPEIKGKRLRRLVGR